MSLCFVCFVTVRSAGRSLEAWALDDAIWEPCLENVGLATGIVASLDGVSGRVLCIPLHRRRHQRPEEAAA